MYKNPKGTFREFSSLILFDKAHISVYSPSFDFPFPFWTYNDSPDMKKLCENFSRILKPNGLQCVWHSEINRQIVLAPKDSQVTIQPMGFTKDKTQFMTLKKTKYFDSSFYYQTKGEIVLNNYAYNNNYGLFSGGLPFSFMSKLFFVDHEKMIGSAGKNQFSERLVSSDTIKIDYTFDSSTCSGIVQSKYQQRTISNDKFITTEQVQVYDTTYSLCLDKTKFSLYYNFGGSIYKNSSGYMDTLNLPIYAVGQSLKKSGFWNFFSSTDTSKFFVSGYLRLKTDSLYRQRRLVERLDTIFSNRGK